ncbi:MAG: hypothetical protein ACOYYS_17020 [Chloroflexota bacterium]
MIQRLHFLAIGLATACLVAFYLLTGGTGGVALSLLAGLAWLVLAWLDKKWVAAPAMFLFFMLAAFGAVQERYTVLCLLAGVFALSAWDLSRFLGRLQLLDMQRDASWAQESRHHLRRLLAVDGAGFLLALIAVSVQWRGSFFPVFFLALGVLIALFALVIRLARLTG